MRNVDYIGLDLERAGSQVTLLGDVTLIPVKSDSQDVVVCTHVLEHVADDRKAIAELFRVVKPGGLAIISVPLRLGRPTVEDPSITDPQERLRLFGEKSHVRFYGSDLVERLSSAGFDATLDLASELPDDMRERYGLRDDENIFRCRKGGKAAADASPGGQ